MWETAKLLEHWETVKSLGHGKQTNHTKHNEHKDPCLGFMLIIYYKKMGLLYLLVVWAAIDPDFVKHSQGRLPPQRRLSNLAKDLAHDLHHQLYLDAVHLLLRLGGQLVGHPHPLGLRSLQLLPHLLLRLLQLRHLLLQCQSLCVLVQQLGLLVQQLLLEIILDVLSDGELLVQDLLQLVHLVLNEVLLVKRDLGLLLG